MKKPPLYFIYQAKSTTFASQNFICNNFYKQICLEKKQRQKKISKIFKKH
jgi:hypothetical protein